MIIHNSHFDLERMYLKRTAPFVHCTSFTHSDISEICICDRTLYKNVHVSGMEILCFELETFLFGY